MLQAPFACNTRCYCRRSPVTPGVTGAVLAKSACNTGCYRRTPPVTPVCYRRTAPVTPGVTGDFTDPNFPRTVICFLIFLFFFFLQVTRSRILYNELSLVAEVGGYVGLFLGVSILQLGDVLEWATRRCGLMWS